MSDTGVRVRPAWPPVTVLLLTLAWLGGLVAALWQIFAISMQRWAAYPDGASAVASERRADLWGSVFLAVLAAGPVVTAVVAAVGGLRKTAIVYGVLAVPLVGLALVVAADAQRDPQPPPGPPGHCVEHSGGDTRCPGG